MSRADQDGGGVFDSGAARREGESYFAIGGGGEGSILGGIGGGGKGGRNLLSGEAGVGLGGFKNGQAERAARRLAEKARLMGEVREGLREIMNVAG